MAITTYKPEQKIGVATLTARLQALAEASGSIDRQYCLIDLDDCALDSSPRSVDILEAHLRELHYEGTPQELVEERIGAARKLLLDGQVPYLARDLWQAVAPGTSAKLEAEWLTHWSQHFFTNEALLHDSARPGVIEFLNGLARYFPRVGYLTGRHTANPTSQFPKGMQMGTEATLWRHKFPLGPLFMKGQWDKDDVGYKKAKFRELVTADSLVVPIGYIDNEPGCVLAHHEIMTEAGIPHLSVWFNGVHSTPMDLPPEVLVLETFTT